MTAPSTAIADHNAPVISVDGSNAALEHSYSHWTSDQTRFGIYFHWPFCAAKCPYCDFNSHVRRAPVDQDAFADALITELQTQAGWLDAKPPVDSIFFGGGTPSLMTGRTVERLLEAVVRIFPLAADTEITLEANPTSVEAGRFADYRRAGVNRVSVGVQALNDADLRALGRLHCAREALGAVELAAATFDRYSFDLIYARPRQSVDAWRAELEQALSFSPQHLSAYQLTIEPGTAFHALHAAGKLKVPEAELANDLFEVTQELCTQAGLPAYEVSNHASPGAQSRHNLVYWRSGQFLGVGPGAHGRIIHGDETFATGTIKSPELWRATVASSIDGAPQAATSDLIETRAAVSSDLIAAELRRQAGHGLDELTPLTVSELADELLVMGLRLSEGVCLAQLRARAGQTVGTGSLASLADDGLITAEGLAQGRIVPTRAGRNVTNALAVELSRALVAHA